MNSIILTGSHILQAYSEAQRITAHNLANADTQGFKPSGIASPEKRFPGIYTVPSVNTDRVDLSGEVTGLLANAHGLKAGIAVIAAGDEMTRELLSIKV